MSDPETFAKYIDCLSTLETKTSSLYEALSQKAELPIVKTLFRNIAQDSAKHSTLLKGIGESIAKVKENPKECAKKLGVVWQTIDSLQKKVTERKKISNSEFSQFLEELTLLESSVGEEYYILVQMKTLQLLGKEIERSYHIDLGHLKRLFESIIRDEEHHRELLETIEEHIAANIEKPDEGAPMVRYQNPDAWSQATPSI